MSFIIENDSIDSVEGDDLHIFGYNINDMEIESHLYKGRKKPGNKEHWRGCILMRVADFEARIVTGKIKHKTKESQNYVYSNIVIISIIIAGKLVGRCSYRCDGEEIVKRYACIHENGSVYNIKEEKNCKPLITLIERSGILREASELE